MQINEKKALNWAKTDYLTEDSIYYCNMKIASINHETRVITRLPLEYQKTVPLSKVFGIITAENKNGINRYFITQATRTITQVAKKLGSHIGRTGNPVPYQVDNANYNKIQKLRMMKIEAEYKLKQNINN